MSLSSCIQSLNAESNFHLTNNEVLSQAPFLNVHKTQKLGREQLREKQNQLLGGALLRPQGEHPFL